MSEQIKWVEINHESVDCYGVDANFERMPRDIAGAVSSGVAGNAKNPAGGRIRFRTDSGRIIVRAEMSGTRGVPFDLYKSIDGYEICVGAFRRPECFICNGSFESSERSIGKSGVMKSFTLNLPYLGQIKKLELGIDGGAVLERGDRYINELPVVFYGSSITHGAWASRPGMTYEAMISQRYNLNYLNFGFAGAAKGEQAMADYLASLGMCAFVCDYDHNSSLVEEHEKTDLPLYETIRAKHPDIPYIFVTRPDYIGSPETSQKLADTIHKTYEHALSIGDKKVYFIEGKTLYNGDYYHSCTTDGCHPNDLGFYRMAEAIGPVVASSLGIESKPHDFISF